VDQDLALRFILVVAGLVALAFGIANEFSIGWQLDIVNLITIFGGIVVILLGIFVRRRKQLKKQEPIPPEVVDKAEVD
jgi:membrane protein implicated in regulation of membrane protease activity